MQMVNKIISKAHKQSKTLPREPDRLEQPAFGLATASLQPGGRTWTRQQLTTLSKSWEQR